MRWALSLLFLISWFRGSHQDPIKGAITLLIYKLDKAAARNVAIYEKFYKVLPLGTVDIIIFHEGASVADQEALQLKTPQMPIRYIDVKDHFVMWRSRMAVIDNINNKLCPATKASNFFKIGYKLMCWFWYKKFLDYLPVEYVWMLRVDDDVIVQDGFKDPSKWAYDWASPVKIASTLWSEIPTDTSKYSVGSLQRGMNQLAREFLVEKNMSYGWTDDGKIFAAPYTNVLYLDVNWWRRHVIVREYANRVEESTCFTNNRWGDLELWGYNTHIAGTKPYLLPIPYLHRSHHCVATNRFCLRFPEHDKSPCIAAPLNVNISLAWVPK